MPSNIVELLKGSKVEIIYPATVDGIIAAALAARVAGDPEDALMSPYVPGTTPPRPRGEGKTVVAVGLEAVRKAIRGSWRVIAVLKRGEEASQGFASASDGFTYASSLHKALAGMGHPVLAAASLVSAVWSLARVVEEYDVFMKEAGMDPEEDYWVPETVAVNLLSIVESCRSEGLRWYPRLMAMNTVEPVKAAFEDALLATLRAQADYESRILAEEALERALEPCEGVKAVGLEADWNLGVSIARILYEEAVKEGYTFVLAFTSRCNSSRYVVVGGSLKRGSLQWKPENGYYLEAGGRVWGLDYVRGGEDLRGAYLSLVERLCKR